MEFPAKAQQEKKSVNYIQIQKKNETKQKFRWKWKFATARQLSLHQIKHFLMCENMKSFFFKQGWRWKSEAVTNFENAAEY